MSLDLKAEAIVGLGGATLTGLLRTARYEVSGREHYEAWWGVRKPAIFVLWHGRLLPCSYYHRHDGAATLISRHRDGDYIAGVVDRWWGFRPLRGSSSRGGSAALRQIVRVLHGGTAVAITPDGPRGPRQKMKPGPVLAAQMAGVPLIPITAGAARAWWVGGWDRFLVPKPFTRIHLVYGEPVFVSPDAGEEEIQQVQEDLERRLNDLTATADARAGRS